MVHKCLIAEAKVEPSITSIGNDNWLEFTVCYVVAYKLRRSRKDSLFSRIVYDIDQTDGRVSIVSTTLRLIETPVFDVRINNQTPGQYSLNDHELTY